MARVVPKWEQHTFDGATYHFQLHSEDDNSSAVVAAADSRALVRSLYNSLMEITSSSSSLQLCAASSADSACSNDEPVDEKQLYAAAAIVYTSHPVRISMLDNASEVPQSDADYAIDEWSPFFICLILGEYELLETFMLFHIQWAKKLLVGRHSAGESSAGDDASRCIAVGDDVRFLLIEKSGEDEPIEAELCRGVAVHSILSAAVPVIKALGKELVLHGGSQTPHSSSRRCSAMNSSRRSLDAALDAFVDDSGEPPVTMVCRRLVAHVHGNLEQAASPKKPQNRPLVKDTATAITINVDTTASTAVGSGGARTTWRAQLYVGADELFGAVDGQTATLALVLRALPVAPVIATHFAHGHRTPSAATLHYAPQEGKRVLLLEEACGSLSSYSSLLQFPSHALVHPSRDVGETTKYFFAITLFHLSFLRKLLSASVSIQDFKNFHTAALRRWEGSAADKKDHTSAWWMPLGLPCIYAIGFSKIADEACRVPSPTPIMQSTLDKLQLLLDDETLTDFLLSSPANDSLRFSELWCDDGDGGTKKFKTRIEMLIHVCVQQPLERNSDVPEKAASSAWLQIWINYLAKLATAADSARSRFRLDVTVAQHRRRSSASAAPMPDVEGLQRVLSDPNVGGDEEEEDDPHSHVNVRTRELVAIIRAIDTLSNDLKEMFGSVSGDGCVGAAGSPTNGEKPFEEVPLEDQFENAQKGFARHAGKHSDQTKLLFYGLFKQAKEGNIRTSRPWALDMTGRAKWDAWHSFNGMSKEDAMRRYVSEWGIIKDRR